MNLEIQSLLEGRLAGLESLVMVGIIPGIMDCIEKEQLIGRIKELRLFLKLLASDDISKTIMELVKG